MVGSTRSEFRLNGAIGDKKLVTNCANGFVGSQKTTPKKIFFGTVRYGTVPKNRSHTFIFDFRESLIAHLVTNFSSPTIPIWAYRQILWGTAVFGPKMMYGTRKIDLTHSFLTFLPVCLLQNQFVSTFGTTFFLAYRALKISGLGHPPPPNPTHRPPVPKNRTHTFIFDFRESLIAHLVTNFLSPTIPIWAYRRILWGTAVFGPKLIYGTRKIDLPHSFSTFLPVCLLQNQFVSTFRTKNVWAHHTLTKPNFGLRFSPPP